MEHNVLITSQDTRRAWRGPRSHLETKREQERMCGKKKQASKYFARPLATVYISSGPMTHFVCGEMEPEPVGSAPRCRACESSSRASYSGHMSVARVTRYVSAWQPLAVHANSSLPSRGGNGDDPITVVVGLILTLA